MISYQAFGSLRLRDFLASRKIEEVSGRRFDERTWVGELWGFTEWLRPARSPDQLGSLSLDMNDLPARVVAAVLAALDLPLEKGMGADALQRVLGKPTQTRRFVAERLTYEFRVAAPVYVLSATVQRRQGLIYLVVSIPRNAMPKPKPGPKSKAKPKPRPESSAEPKRKAQPKAKPKPKARAEPKRKAKPKPKPKLEPKAKPKPKAKPSSSVKAKPKRKVRR